jgi:hypothetical protein
MGAGDNQTVTVLTAESFFRPYTIQRAWYHPLGMSIVTSGKIAMLSSGALTASRFMRRILTVSHRTDRR